MNKKSIFDIEKVGFGDEGDDFIALSAKEVKKPKRSFPNVEDVVKKPSEAKKPTMPKQILATPKVVTKAVKVESKPIERTKPKNFKPNIFVSPIYGIRKPNAAAETESSTESPLEVNLKDEIILQVEEDLNTQDVIESQEVTVVDDKVEETLVEQSENTLEPLTVAHENEQTQELDEVETTEEIEVEEVETTEETEVEEVEATEETDAEEVETTEEAEVEEAETTEEAEVEEAETTEETDVEEVETTEETDVEEAEVAEETDVEEVEATEEVDAEVVQDKQEDLMSVDELTDDVSVVGLDEEDIFALLQQEEMQNDDLQGDAFQSVEDNLISKSHEFEVVRDQDELMTDSQDLMPLDQDEEGDWLPIENSVFFDEDDDFVEFSDLLDSEPEEESVNHYYETPSLDLLNDEVNVVDDLEDWIVEKMDVLENTFESFSVKAKVTGDYTKGPTITQIELSLEPGTKVNKILSLEKELKLALAVEDLRIEAPIPGKSTIGIELPNPTRQLVQLKEILRKPEFMLHPSPLYVGLGRDIAGEAAYTNLLEMPHGLVAGQTGSGKSVCINTLLTSILYKASPEDVRLMLIDPKRVELTPYNEIPHLLTPVITDEQKAAIGLKWVVEEMERRYELFSQNGVRDVNAFNERRIEFEVGYPKLPYILVIIDELADLMMVSAQEVEDCIMRLTQKARAAGIHLVVATQRPTVDVITGVIKSNIPSRIAFAVAQANDSRTILDESGAQNLLGKGDMFLSQNGSHRLKRIQGAYISDEEVERVVSFVKSQAKPNYLIDSETLDKRQTMVGTDCDPLLDEVISFIIDAEKVSISLLQRRFNIGYNRAARIVDTLEARQFISSATNSGRPRDVLITKSQYAALMHDETRY